MTGETSSLDFPTENAFDSTYNFGTTDSFITKFLVAPEPPEKPITPSGRTNGIIGDEYIYSTSSIDPNGDQITYGWDWDGDYIVDEWTNFFSSGMVVSPSPIDFKVWPLCRKSRSSKQLLKVIKDVQMGISTPASLPISSMGTRPKGTSSVRYRLSSSFSALIAA